MRPKAIIFAIVSGLAATHAGAQSPGIAVLKNGQVIEGQIIRGADSATILMPSGSRLIIENDRIDAFCTSLTDAYWNKNSQIKATDVDGHTQLFHWCLRHMLLKEAQNQIDILQMMEGLKATRLEYLNRQLVVKSRRQGQDGTSQQALANLPQKTAGKKPVELTGDADPTDSESTIAQVNFESDWMPPPTSIADLERTTKSLPKEAVVMYKKKIEPLISRSCYTADCHNTRDHKMALMRFGSNRLFPKRVSQRNLHSILQYAETDDPLNSPFFRAATRPHAGQDEPFIKRGTKQFEMLKQWLALISTSPADDYERPPEEQPDDKMELPLPAPDMNTIGPSLEKHAGEFPVPPSIPSLNSQPPRKAIRRDPFDPRFFNQKYGSKKKE